MAFKWTLICIFSVAVCSLSAAQNDTIIQNCSALAEQLSAVTKVAVQCGEKLPQSTQQSAALLLSLRNLAENLHKHQLKDCHGAEPRNCSEAKVPDHGGLACVTVENKRYCKPLCNNGFDFGFLRISRSFDECSQQTQYKWNTQYIGGNTLAVCQESLIQISGSATAYFPKDQDCLTTKSDIQLQDNLIEDLTNDLKNQGIQGIPQNPCLVCGRP